MNFDQSDPVFKAFRKPMPVFWITSYIKVYRCCSLSFHFGGNNQFILFPYPTNRNLMEIERYDTETCKRSYAGAWLGSQTFIRN